MAFSSICRANVLSAEGSRQTHCAMIKFLQNSLTAGANPNVSFNAKKRRFQSKFRGVFMFRSSCECFKMINPTLPYSVSLTVVFGKKLVKDFLTKLFGKNDLKSTIELQVQFGCKVPSEIISKRVEKFKRSKGFSNVLILIFDYMATWIGILWSYVTGVLYLIFSCFIVCLYASVQCEKNFKNQGKM